MIITANETINAKTVNILNKKKIYTYNDLATLAPRKYRDYRKVTIASPELVGEFCAVQGTLVKIERKPMRSNPRRKYITGKIVQKNGESIFITFFCNVYKFGTYFSYLDSEVVACGKLSYSEEFGYSISNPDIFKEEKVYKPHIKRIYPKYSGITEENLKAYIMDAVKETIEPLETEILLKDKLPDYKESLMALHMPSTAEDVKKGRYRIVYNQMLYFAICLYKDLWLRARESKIVFEKTKETKELIEKLPFKLTEDQLKAIETIIEKTKEKEPCDVLLQGDVGCGKTIVAVLAMCAAWENGYQSVLLAPRSVLALQHYESVKEYADMLGIGCVYLHSGMKKKERSEALKKIANKEAMFIIGTHSVLGADIEYASLGLVITDEEHLFGVAQKEAIKEKALDGFHKISMSATPIPRTVAQSLYGGIKEIVTIKTKPAGRKDIITGIANDKERVFKFVEKEINKGGQTYVVCPAIEENEGTDIKSVEEVLKEYKKYFLPKGIGIACVHGKMKKEEIEAEMQRFVSKEAQILISTTVIEVGVNVPDATVMVIEQADRFGLASLHQLRGRVGRSDKQSFCVLMAESAENERLKALCKTNDGFKIAEEDLRLRKSGNLIGIEQAGQNKYVELMLKYPKLWEKVVGTAKLCLVKGYGKELCGLFEEAEK